VKKVVVSVMVIGCLLGLNTLAAQATDKLRVGVVDGRKVVLESKYGQHYNTEREKMVKDRRDKLAKEKAEIQSLQDKFEKDKLVLTDKQKTQQQKSIEDRIAAFQKKAQEAEQELTKRDGEFSNKASAIFRDIVAEIAKQEKIAMVVERNQSGIIWVEEEVDITDKVAKAYEAKTEKESGK